MIKLINLLKEITEAKQVGLLYHFTPLDNLENLLTTRHIFTNEEDQISASIRANMDTYILHNMSKVPILRLTLDGDKISNKYKIRPFAYFDDQDTYEHEDLGEEQIVTNGKDFPFFPYLKRMDIFLNGHKLDPKVPKLLEKYNIPFKVYEGTPIDNTPYKQDMSGDPKNIVREIEQDKIDFSELDKIDDVVKSAIEAASHKQNEVDATSLTLLALAAPGIVNNVAKIVKSLLSKFSLKKGEQPIDKIIRISGELDNKLDSPIRTMLRPFVKDDSKRNKATNIIKALVLLIAGILTNADISKSTTLVDAIKAYMPGSWQDVISIKSLPDLASKAKTLFA
jgi:hypothetical protein